MELENTLRLTQRKKNIKNKSFLKKFNSDFPNLDIGLLLNLFVTEDPVTLVQR